MENFKIKNLMKDVIYLTIGCFITAFSVNYILKPNGLITSGLTGLAIVIEKYSNINYSYVYYGLTIAVLIFTWIMMGKKEIFKILLLSVMYPTVLLVMQNFEFKFVENDLLLASIYFSVFYGVGVGIVLRKGFSYGGTDTIAKIINRKFLPSVNISNILLVLDGATIIIAAFVFGRNIALYSIISQLIVTKVIDYVMFGFRSELYKLEIISCRHEEVSNYIMHEIKRGVTIFEVTGGYTNEKRMQISTACSPSQSVAIKQFLKTVDPIAFVEVLPMVSVWGVGSRFINISDDK